MNRLLRFVSSTFYVRPLWPVLAFLSLYLTNTSAGTRFRLKSYTLWLLMACLLNGLYITNAQAQSPGGVSSGLTGWFKANTGAGVTNGAGVSTWTNQTPGSTYHLTQPTATKQPLFYSTTSAQLINFNPVVYFDGSNDYVRNVTTFMPSNTPYTFMAVDVDESADKGYNSLFSSEEIVDYFSLYKQNGAPSDNGWVPYSIGGISDRGSFGNGTKYSIAGGSNGYWNGANFTSDATTQILQPQVVGFNSDNVLTSTAAARAGFSTWVDGYKSNPGWAPTDELNSTYQSRFFKALAIGADVGTNDISFEFWKGRVPEFIVYSRQLTDAEMARINTYLAIKYGTTLGQGNGFVAKNGNNYDYVNSSGVSIWSASTNATYGSNIFGIGRDDASALDQRQSKSQQTNGLVTISNGTGLAATNAANTNTFSADLSYDVIGDNGLSTGYATAYLPQTYASTVPSAFRLMSRIWKVQETGTVGTITISIPASSNAEALLVSNNAAFTPGTTTELTLTSDGNGNLTAQVDLANGQYFTFGATVIAPGGVSASLDLWLKADGITGISNGASLPLWTSSTIDSYTVAQTTASAQPTFYNSTAGKLVNFNPAPYFDGGDELKNLLDRLYANTSPYSLISVGVDQRGTAGSYRATMGIGDDGNYPALDSQFDGVSPNGWNPWMTGSSPAEWSGGSARMADNGLTNTQGNILALTSSNLASATDNIVSYVNGYKETTTLDSYQTNGINQIGKSLFVGSSGDAQYIGLIPEVIAYEQQLSDTDMQKIQSYLAIKYGLTLGQSSTTTAGLNATNYNYLATNGTVIWNTATNTGYTNDIFGIGRDDAEALNQKQSKSQQPEAIVSISNGATMAATNAANSNSFSANISYEIIGDNGLSTNYATAYTPNSFTSAAPYFLMSRIWKVQETGTVGTITISAPGNTGMYLLVKNDASLGSGATEIAMTSDGNGNMTAQVNLVNGQYFTFAQGSYAPGAVAPGLSFWAKADVSGAVVGTSPAAWPDNSLNGKAIPTVGSLPVQAPDAAHNFHPYFTSFSSSNYFYDTQSLLSTDNSTGGVGTQQPQNLSVFAVVKPSASTSKGKITGIDNDNLFASEPGFALVSGKPYYYKFSNTVQSFNHTTAVTGGQNSVIGWQSGTNASYDGLTMSLNGSSQTFNLVNSGLVGQKMTIGYASGWDQPYPFEGDIQEVIWYKNGNGALTTQQINQIESYLAIKYGVTLSHNYLSGTGATIYNVSSFSANITGIGREDSQQLNQKQSKSGNSGAKLTIGVSNTIAASNAANPGSFTNNASFTVFGDNGLTGLSSFSAGGSCPTPPSADKWTNLAYKVTETGSVPSTQLQLDATGFGFNAAYPVWMQVANDASFSSLIASVPMSLSGSTATGTYDFPANTTVYVRFAGNTTSLANSCVAPKIQTFHWNGWNYGQKTKTITGNFGVGNTLSNPIMVATVTDGTTDANVLLYKPTVNWWPVFDGQNLFFPRNDNSATSQQNSIITTKMQFFAQSSLGVASTSAVAAQSVDFKLRDIDGYIGGKDIVKVYGKLGGVTVIPKIGRNHNYPFWDNSALTINNSTGVITAGWYPWDLTVLGDAYVTFDSPVEEVYVEYTKQNQYSFKVYNDIRIGAINVACKQPTPRTPLVDNVYVYKQVSANPEKVNEVATYKFTIQNTTCDNKVINFNDVLPSGLTWVDSTATTDLAWSSVNNYGNGQTLAITSMTVTPGTSYLYASVRGTTAGVYNNQASYVVTNGTGASYLSDDPGQSGTAAQPTPLTLIANDPEAQLAVTKSVDKSTSQQNGILTYTYKISNAGASAVNTTFQDLLPGELTFVGGSLSGLSGSYTSSTAVTPYSGSAVLAMRDLSVPASSTLTFTIQANVNSYTIGQTATNIAQVSPDINSGYRIRTFTSNGASTTITSNATFTFNCATASIAGSFTANGSGGQTGTLTIPITGATAGPASVSITAGSGFVTSPSPFTLNLTAGQTSISVPVVFDGTGSPGTRTLTVVSPNATGTCSPTATIQASATLPTIAILTPTTNSTVAATPAPVVSGTATPGAVVTLKSPTNANLCSTTASASGSWSCAVGVPSGPQTITATATNSGGSADATTTFTAVTPLSINSSPATITATSGQPQAGNAATAVNPGGGTLPFTYTAFNPVSGSATSSGTSSTPHGSVSIDPVTGAYSYTATPGYSGTDAIGVKVCDSGTPQQCQSTIIPVNVAPQPGQGSIDCSKIILTGVQQGTASQGVLKLTINVTQVGLMPVTVSGSGLSLSQSPYNLNATALGTHHFYVPVHYDGTAFGPMTINVDGVGTCSPDLTGLSPKVISQPVLNLGDTCTPPSAATLIK